MSRPTAPPMSDWWVCTPHGRLPWWRLAGLSSRALQLYALLLELAEAPDRVVPHPSACEHATEIVEGWSLAELGRRLGTTASSIVTARRQLEHAGLVALLAPASRESAFNVYAITRGVYGDRCPAELPRQPPPPSDHHHDQPRGS